MKKLSDDLHERITSLSQEGDNLANANDYIGGLRKYHQAWAPGRAAGRVAILRLLLARPTPSSLPPQLAQDDPCPADKPAAKQKPHFRKCPSRLSFGKTGPADCESVV